MALGLDKRDISIYLEITDYYVPTPSIFEKILKSGCYVSSPIPDWFIRSGKTRRTHQKILEGASPIERNKKIPATSQANPAPLRKIRSLALRVFPVKIDQPVEYRIIAL